MGFTLIGEETTWSATLGLALDEGIFSQSKKKNLFISSLSADRLTSYSIDDFNIFSSFIRIIIMIIIVFNV